MSADYPLTSLTDALAAVPRGVRVDFQDDTGTRMTIDRTQEPEKADVADTPEEFVPGIYVDDSDDILLRDPEGRWYLIAWSSGEATGVRRDDPWHPNDAQARLHVARLIHRLGA